MEPGASMNDEPSSAGEPQANLWWCFPNRKRRVQATAAQSRRRVPKRPGRLSPDATLLSDALLMPLVACKSHAKGSSSQNDMSLAARPLHDESSMRMP